MAVLGKVVSKAGAQIGGEFVEKLFGKGIKAVAPEVIEEVRRINPMDQKTILKTITEDPNPAAAAKGWGNMYINKLSEDPDVAEQAAEEIHGALSIFTTENKEAGKALEIERLLRGKNYTRPDAVENLQAAGADRLTGRKTTPRTIQGPVPPRLSDPTFSQGAKSYEEAVMGATTKFVEDGVPKQIRNYGSDTAPHGRVTSVGARKTSGRGITAEGVSTRKTNEALATDPNITPEETAAFGKAMAEAAAEGMDGDHIIEVSRVANAVRNMSPERRKAYFKILKNAGIITGNHPKNIQKLTKELNQVVKPAQIRALDKALRAMDKRSKTLLEEMLGI